MPIINQIFYIFVATFMAGFALNAFFAFRDKSISLEAKIYWGLSISLMSISAMSAAIAAFDIPALLALSNLAVVGVFVSQALLFRSLNRSVDKRLLYYVAAMLVVFVISISVMLTGVVNYGGRLIFMTTVLFTVVFWQMKEIHQLRKRDQSVHLGFIFYMLLLFKVLMLVRVYLVLQHIDISVQYVYQEGHIGLFFRLALASVCLFEFIFIANYFHEKLLIREQQARLNLEKSSADLQASNHEKKRIQNLLDEREQLLKTLMRSNKTSTTGALTASIAHELNQPLCASLLNVQHLKALLQNQQLTPEIELEIFNQLENDTRRAGNIIQSLRAIFSEKSASTAVCVLRELLTATECVMKTEITAKNILLDLFVEPSVKLMCNSGQIQQVIMNLVNNAVDALTQKQSGSRTLSISGFRNAGRVILTIEDNGPGIPEAQHRRLFSLLESDKPSGLGLGLWLCHHIVTNHHGSIRHEAVLGGGARFIIELPAAIE